MFFLQLFFLRLEQNQLLKKKCYIELSQCVNVFVEIYGTKKKQKKKLQFCMLCRYCTRMRLCEYKYLYIYIYIYIYIRYWNNTNSRFGPILDMETNIKNLIYKNVITNSICALYYVYISRICNYVLFFLHRGKLSRQLIEIILFVISTIKFCTSLTL